MAMHWRISGEHFADQRATDEVIFNRKSPELSILPVCLKGEWGQATACNRLYLFGLAEFRVDGSNLSFCLAKLVVVADAAEILASAIRADRQASISWRPVECCCI